MKQNVLIRFVFLLIKFNNLQISMAWQNKQTRPNIVFILADDLGWNDVGFHGSNQIPTPNIDALAYSGTVLHNYYSQPMCTPSRSALLSGRYPISNGMQGEVIYGSEPWGLPLTEKLLPEYLKELGYKNRAIGKWHIGFFKKSYTPVHRGFDSHFGYWLGHEDYFTHEEGEDDFKGYDFRRNMDTSWSSSGKYTTDLLTEEAEQLIREHDVSSPLFLYLAHIATHAPLQAPDDVIRKFDYIEDRKRRIFAAMVTKLDESVGRVVAALKHRGILSNSIIVFTSDNGGATHGYDGNVASNWPLRGGKDTLWEGGVRVPAVIWSPLLETTPAIHAGLMSVSDWLPTLLSAANGTFTPAADKQVDGHNQWDTLQDKAPVPYHTLLHNIYGGRAALRKKDWKVVAGTNHNGRFDGWYGQLDTSLPYDWRLVKDSRVAAAFRGTNRPLPEKTQALRTRGDVTIVCEDKIPTECKPKYSACLFNVAKDPCEKVNLAALHPDILQDLLDLMDAYKPARPNNKRGDPNANPAYWNGTWTNWQDYPPPPKMIEEFYNVEIIKTY